ncbi:hypothetical protein CRUP_014702 [Coryphaenoides rupestris]|nr:hypothetical protein CRUP_014702 [Coryphaenoides rupestris]
MRDDAWDEIRRLAADLQTAQFAQTVQRLSERNCIEIITKLVQDKQLDVVHTLDGKEYITPAQITQEIRDELYIHGGRINIVDLQQLINVDLSHVETRANEVTRTERGVQLVLGQLIDVKYVDRLAEEVNDKLQAAGLITISELCKTYDLPGDYLTEELSRRLGSLVQGQFDQPIPVSTAIGTFGFHEHLLYSVLEELVNSGRLKGTVVGGRQDKAVYIPDIYSAPRTPGWTPSCSRTDTWFDALVRLGIPDPAGYIKKRYRSSKLLFLRAACVGQALVDQLEASVEEAVSSATWVDLQPMLPSSLSQEDVGMLVSQALRNAGVTTSARVLGDSVVVSEKFVKEDMKQTSSLTESSAPSKKEKREAERRKKTTGQWERPERRRRERPRGRGKPVEVPFMSAEEVVAVLEAKAGDFPEEMMSELAEHLARPLSKAYQEVVRAVFLSSTSSPSGANKKKSMKDLQEEVTNLCNNIRLFEKGAKFFSDETQVHITKHLLKTLCSNVTNVLIRAKILGKLPEESRTPLMRLHNCLSGKSIEDFLNNVESSAETCGLLLKKGDKKRERQALFVHRAALVEQLKQTEEPALVLHLTSVLLFQSSTHCMLHAPGRCVPSIIGTLTGRIPTLKDLVLAQRKTSVNED